MNKIAPILILILVFAGSGCTKHSVVKTGMSKQQVVLLLGEPRKVVNSANSCCKKTIEETWHYYSPQKKIHGKAKSVAFENEAVQYVFLW